MIMKLKFVFSLVSLAIFFSGTGQAQEKRTAWGTVGAGYDNLLTEGKAGQWTGSNGWYILPTFNINKQIGVFGDFTNFYAKGLNVHGDTFGALHGFDNRTRFTPFGFIGGGVVRVSNAGSVTTSGALITGAGLMIRITPLVSFETIPVEYVMNTPNGNLSNNFLIRAGLAITIPKKK